MESKKNEARFTIKFNPANPRHREAIRTLNEAGRGKATLIADALCMYIHYGATMSADLLRSGITESAPDTQGTKAGTDKNEDCALLKIMADSADLFFDQT